jgi:ribosomal protein L21
MVSGQAVARTGMRLPANTTATTASVKATVVAQGRHDKVRIFKMRRRKHYQRHGGHRQHYTELQIGAIAADDLDASGSAYDDAF